MPRTGSAVAAAVSEAVAAALEASVAPTAVAAAASSPRAAAHHSSSRPTRAAEGLFYEWALLPTAGLCVCGGMMHADTTTITCDVVTF